MEVVFYRNPRLSVIFAGLKHKDHVGNVGSKLAYESGAVQNRVFFGKVVLIAFHFRIHPRMVHLQVVLQEGRRSCDAS